MNLNFKRVILDFLAANPGLTAANMAMAMTLTPVNDVLLPHMYGKLVGAVEHRQSYTRWLVGVIIVLACVQLGTILKDYLDMRTQPRLFDFVKTRMVSAMLNKYDGDIVEPKTGQVVSKIVRSPDIIAWWTSSVLEFFIPQAFAFIFAFVYFLRVDVPLAMSLSLLIFGIIVLLVCSPARCVAASVRREEMLDNVHEDIEDVMRNLVSVYSNDTSATELDRLHVSGGKFLDANIGAMSCLLKFKAIGAPLIIAFVVAIVLRCCHLINAGKLDTGKFVSIFMITTSMVNTLMWLVAIIKDTTMDAGAVVDSQAFFSKPPDPKSNVLHHPMGSPPFKTGIGFYKATYIHKGSRAPVINDATIHFEEGERTVITGDIGSGKSTMLKLLMAFIKPASGDLYVSGKWYSQMRPNDVRRLVAYMPQDAVLFNRTIAENILYGSTRKTVRDVQELVDRLGVWKEFTNMTDGLDTMVGKNGSRLSGGQRQLVWFLRIVLQDPTFIVLDEPTASMDESTKHVLLAALDVVAQGKTIIMVTHDHDLLQFATRHLSWS